MLAKDGLVVQAYEKYKHLDSVFCAGEAGPQTFEERILYDLWQVIKKAAGEAAPSPVYQPCPCGETPTGLELYALSDRFTRFSVAACNRCGVWSVLFDNDYHLLPSARSRELAAKAWNEAAVYYRRGTG